MECSQDDTCKTSRYEHGYYLLLVVAFLPTFLSLLFFGIAWVWSVSVKKHEICGVPHPSNKHTHKHT